MAAARLGAARHWALRLDNLLVYNAHYGETMYAERTVAWALRFNGLTPKPARVPYYMLRPREMCDLGSCFVLDGGAWDKETGSGLPAGERVAARFIRDKVGLHSRYLG